LVVDQKYCDIYPPDTLPPRKLHPADGHPRHPWVQKQFGLDRTEDKFHSPAEREAAVTAYYGLITWLDDNIGRIMGALDDAGLTKDTTVVYTSDHGDNVEARGLWGKSNMYEESAAIPMIAAGPGYAAGTTCATPVSLVDLSATITNHFGATLGAAAPGAPLPDIAAAPDDTDRAVFSEYHAAGAVTGAFMVRTGRWKLIHYVGLEPELFDLNADPEELTNLAADPAYAHVLADMMRRLYDICDPDAVDALAHADQAAMIERYGGREAALNMGAPAATPPPSLS